MIRVSGERLAAPHTFASWDDGDEWCRSQLRALRAGTWTDPRDGEITLRHYALEQWLPRKRLQPRTAENYRRWMEQKVLVDPALDTSLNHLTPAAIQRWFADLYRRQPSTASKAARALNGCLNMAVADGLIMRNPLELDKGWYLEDVDQDRPYASPEDVERLVAVLPPRWRAVVYLASYCGLRFGEIHGLSVDDVDLVRGTVQVRRAWVEPDTSAAHIGPVKSKAGRRTIAIPPPVLPFLEQHIAQFVSPASKGFLFRGPSGAVPARSNFSTTWTRNRKKAGLPEGFHFHDLRGSGATWLAEDGATLRELMDWLGHSNPRMAERYLKRVQERPGILAERVGRRAAEAMGQLDEAKIVELRRRRPRTA